MHFYFKYIATLTIILPCAVMAAPFSSEIVGYERYPKHTQILIQNAHRLSQMRLKYIYGSADPKNRGMDCSGAIQYLLRNIGYGNPPRSSNEQYHWVAQYGKFHAVRSRQFSSYEFRHLKPGDLLFWTSPYRFRKPAKVKHVMMYVGNDRWGRPLMFGACEGFYKGRLKKGVGLFEFRVPRLSSSDRFVGYGCIPNVTYNYRAG